MIDNKDLKILELLKLNARFTTKQISKKTLLPITTVHNRIKKLENLGVIKNYSVVIDHKKLGKSISAYILMNINYVYLKEKYNRGTNKLFVHVRGTTVVVEHDRKRVPYLLKNIWGIY